MRRARLQLIENRVTNALGIAAQMGIPKSQRFDAARLQKFFPLHVMLALIGKTVLAAVQFNVQFRLLTKEIQMVNADGILVAKFVAAKATVAQPAPDEYFRSRFLFAKLAGAFDVGHDANLENGDAMEKFILRPCFTSALILTFSPGEKEQLLFVSVLSDDGPVNPVVGLSERRRTILLLLGEKAGMREGVTQSWELN
jgi:hypothetical protein